MKYSVWLGVMMSDEGSDKNQPMDANKAAKARESLAQMGDRKYSIFVEFWTFMKEEKKWWLAPILLVLLLLGTVVVLGETAAGPFIYALF